MTSGDGAIGTETMNAYDICYLPWNPSCLHHVGHGDVIRVEVKLPLDDAEDPAQHRPAVDPDSHV